MLRVIFIPLQLLASYVACWCGQACRHTHRSAASFPKPFCQVVRGGEMDPRSLCNAECVSEGGSGRACCWGGAWAIKRAVWWMNATVDRQNQLPTGKLTSVSVKPCYFYYAMYCMRYIIACCNMSGQIGIKTNPQWRLQICEATLGSLWCDAKANMLTCCCNGV